MTDTDARTPRRSRLTLPRVTRDGMLFLLGVAIAVNEVFVATEPRPEALLFAVTCLGGIPLSRIGDNLRDRNSRSNEERDR